MRSLQMATVGFVRNEQPVSRILDHVSGLTARLALSKQTREDAFRIRHSSYLAGGNIEPRPRGLFSDDYDNMPNCQSIVIYMGQRPVASVRVCVLDTDPAKPDWHDVPAVRIFPEEIKSLIDSLPVREKPVRLIEINRLVRHPDFADDYALVFALYRLAGFMILHHNVETVLSCVRQNHIPFYKRLKFKSIAGLRPYLGLKFPTSLMACPRENYDDVRRSVPFLDSTATSGNNYLDLVRGDTISIAGA